MFLVVVAIVIALFFAMNIGASGTAAAMGAAYGGGAIKKRWIAVLFVGIAALLGAVAGGGEVVKTIGKEIIPTDILSVEIVRLNVWIASSFNASNNNGDPRHWHS